ncbi:MAG: hypothetical protein ACK58T_15945, partial [Phycisphaerae bacterium]
DVPGAGGILRPTLHGIMSARLRELGVPVRLGLTATAIEPAGPASRVRFSDGSSETVDLVVGADGLFSGMRKLLFPEAGATALARRDGEELAPLSASLSDQRRLQEAALAPGAADAADDASANLLLLVNPG